MTIEDFLLLIGAFLIIFFTLNLLKKGILYIYRLTKESSFDKQLKRNKYYRL